MVAHTRRISNRQINGYHTVRKPNMVVRSLISRPSRTILTTFAIVLGVAVILAIRITNESTLDSLITLFTETSGRANLVVINSKLDDAGFSEDIIHNILNYPGIKTAVPTVQAYTTLTDDSPAEIQISFMGAGTDRLSLFGVDPVLDPLVREYNLVAGEFLSDNKSALDVVLVEEYANENKVWVKDKIEIITPDGVEKLRIVGIISKDGAGLLNNGAFGVIPIKAAQRIFNYAGQIDQIDIIAEEGLTSANELDNLLIALQNRIGEDYSVIYPAMQGRRVTQMLDTLSLGLSFFSAIAIFVGIFLIYNAFSMTVTERTREIGMLRTIGMTRRQVTKQILTEAIVIGSLGSILGICVGLLLSRGLIRFMETLFAQEVKEVLIPFDGILVAVFVGISTTLLAAWLPARQAGNISPLEALRIRGKSNGSWLVARGWIFGAGLILLSVAVLILNPFSQGLNEIVATSTVIMLFIGATLLIPISVSSSEKIIKPIMGHIYGGEGQLGSSNVQRAKLRTTLTVAALMVGVAMMLTIQAMTVAFKQDIEDWLSFFNGSDLIIYSSLPMKSVLGGRLNAVKGVAIVTPIRMTNINFTQPDGQKGTLIYTAIEPKTYPKVTSFSFATNQGDPELLYEALATRDAIFITTVLSERYGYKQGDTIRLQTKRGQKDFEIAAIVTDFVAQGYVVEGSYRLLKRYFGDQDVSRFMVDIEPGYTIQEVKERINATHGKRENLTIETNEATRESGSALLSNSFALFDVVAQIGVIVASLGVINTLMMNILERTQEIGMLRGMGMTRRQIGKMILAEAGMMGIIGGVFGLGFGLFLSWLLINSFLSLIGYTVDYILPLRGIFIGLIISLIISQIAALWPARRAARVNIVEAIQYE